MKIKLLTIALLLLCCGFTYRDIASGPLASKSVTGLRPMQDGERYSLMDSLGIHALRYDGRGEAELIFSSDTLKFFDYQLNTSEQKILLSTNRKAIYRRSFTADHYLYDRPTGRLTRLTEAGGEQQATFSPDGSKVGFVRDNDLYVLDLPTGELQRITTDGKRNEIINGLPDWVYEEEYGLTRAFAFSPDGTRIAWLRFDESRVKEFTMMRYDGELYPTPYTFKYPMAGEENAEVVLQVRDLVNGGTRHIASTVGAAVSTPFGYIPLFGFTPQGEPYYVSVDRSQRELSLMIPTPSVYTDDWRAYTERVGERPDGQTFTLLPDGRLVVMSEQSGRRHLYLYRRNDQNKYLLENPITSGDWDVDRLVAIEGRHLWYTSAEGSPLRRNLYRVDLNGKNKRRITQGGGVYTISPGKKMRYYVSTFSNASTPPQTTIHRADGTPVRTLEANSAVAEAARELPRKEFFTCRATDGTPLNGYMIRPKDFDPTKRYPVLMSQYSGPGSQEVLDRWRLDWQDVLVRHGYIVVCVDGRGTGMRGRDFRQVTYGRLGQIEVQDQLFVASWIAQQPWADASRIGIYGWSYGGFVALGCILSAESPFKMAIAVAPVTSWRFYDTIYTEIYNRDPQHNRTGYDDFAPIHLASNLRGKLLLVHGTGDDNVHLRNTLEMARALVAADKPFDMALYPDDNHSMLPSGRVHVRERMIEYTLQNL